jgi:hypothetical protein
MGPYEIGLLASMIATFTLGTALGACLAFELRRRPAPTVDVEIVSMGGGRQESHLSRQRCCTQIVREFSLRYSAY